MQILVDNVEVLNLTDIQVQILKDYVSSDIFESDMQRRVNYIITHLLEQATQIMITRETPNLLANGVQSIPTDPESLAQLIISQPGYMDKKARDTQQITQG